MEMKGVDPIPPEISATFCGSDGGNDPSLVSPRKVKLPPVEIKGTMNGRLLFSVKSWRRLEIFPPGLRLIVRVKREVSLHPLDPSLLWGSRDGAVEMVHVR